MADQEQLRFDPWEPVRDAIAHAYKELGLPMEQVDANMRRYNPTHWNIAGKVYEWARSQNAGGGHCYGCGCALTFGTVIRCLDCRASMCERCAPEHFGPQHGQRAATAHPAMLDAAPAAAVPAVPAWQAEHERLVREYHDAVVGSEIACGTREAAEVEAKARNALLAHGRTRGVGGLDAAAFFAASAKDAQALASRYAWALNKIATQDCCAEQVAYGALLGTPDEPRVQENDRA